jgi:hypothetical protein
LLQQAKACGDHCIVGNLPAFLLDGNTESSGSSRSVFIHEWLRTWCLAEKPVSSGLSALLLFLLLCWRKREDGFRSGNLTDLPQPYKPCFPMCGASLEMGSEYV